MVRLRNLLAYPQNECRGLIFDASPLDMLLPKTS
jgi:hypothetical protein